MGLQGGFDQARDAMSEHPEQVQQGVDKAGDMVDEKTGGQHAEQVDQAQQAVSDRLGAGGDQPADQPPADQPPAQ